MTFDNGTTAISLGTIGSGNNIGGDLTLKTDAATTISNAITLDGKDGNDGADLSITVAVS